MIGCRSAIFCMFDLTPDDSAATSVLDCCAGDSSLTGEQQV
ncbi:MAG: hypothetical protein ACRDSP_10980 [Pseudonocardiaceae bacterium]